MTRQEIERKIIDVARRISNEYNGDCLQRLAGRMEVLIAQLDALPKEQPK